MHAGCDRRPGHRTAIEIQELCHCRSGPLFPTFALIAHYIVGTERTGEDLRATALFGLWSLLPYALYLTVVYLMSVRYSLATTLISATAVWSIAASLLIWVNAP